MRLNIKNLLLFVCIINKLHIVRKRRCYSICAFADIRLIKFNATKNEINIKLGLLLIKSTKRHIS